MSGLDFACPPMYHTILSDLRNEVHNFTNRDKFEKHIEEVYNSGKYDIPLFSVLDKDTPFQEIYSYMFDIIKVTKEICENDYGYTPKLTYPQKSVDLYVYLCAKEIMDELCEEYNIPDEEPADPDEDYNHHKDEYDMELREI